jgi:hypothetical protein
MLRTNIFSLGSKNDIAPLKGHKVEWFFIDASITLNLGLSFNNLQYYKYVTP